MTEKIHIIGLGPGGIQSLSLGAMEVLNTASTIYFRTAIHPVVDTLKDRGIVFQSFDDFYEQCDSFEQVYEQIVATLMARARTGQGFVYAVPGHPLVAEATVSLLLEQLNQIKADFTVLPGVSFLEAMYATLGIDPSKGMRILDALLLTEQLLEPNIPCIITQAYNRQVCSDTKLTLMERYPDDHKLMVVRAAGILGEERQQVVPLYELDRLPWVDHLTSIYLPPVAHEVNQPYSLRPLVDVMATLRSPGGCPWDVEQTHTTLRRYAVEEVYEVLEAAEQGDMDKLCDELGDLLLQIVFHARVAEENMQFSIDDVIHTVTEKMIRRHPHVFGSVQADTPDDVMRNWEKIKKTEKGYDRQSILDGVPAGLPALMRAFKLQVKAAKVGFDWPEVQGAWDKLYEEIDEFKQALRGGDTVAIEQEFGDILFALVNVGRFTGVEPETALTAVNHKFIRRFQHIEQCASEQGIDVRNMSLAQMDELWDQAKRAEK